MMMMMMMKIHANIK